MMVLLSNKQKSSLRMCILASMERTVVIVGLADSDIIKGFLYVSVAYNLLFFLFFLTIVIPPPPFPVISNDSLLRKKDRR